MGIDSIDNDYVALTANDSLREITVSYLIHRGVHPSGTDKPNREGTVYLVHFIPL